MTANVWKKCWGSVVAAAVLLGVAMTPALADDEKRVLEPGKWYWSAEGGINLSQASYSDNWSGGDRGAIVWTGIFNASGENQLNPKLNWLNTLKLAFGQTHQQVVDGDGERSWDRPEKSSDLIDFESVGRFTLGGWVDPYVSFGIESQFIDATDPFGRDLNFNPIKFQEAAGVARKFIDTEDESLLSRVGFAFRQTSRDIFEAAPPSDATVTESTNDGGIEWITDYKTKIFEDKVAWTSKLSVFQPVFYSAQDDFDAVLADSLVAANLDSNLADFTTVVDVAWENLFTTQITKFIAFNFYVQWMYDKYDNSVPLLTDSNGSVTNADAARTATRKAGQFKQTMAIGITYRFL